jgi:hypothetical protein
MVLDPTYALAVQRADGEWATAKDLSNAVRRQTWANIRFVPLDGDTISRLKSSYIDYPLYFVSPFGQDPPRPDVGPSVLRYYEEVALPLPVKERGTYAIRCLDGSTAVVDRRLRSRYVLRDRLSEIRTASSIEERQENTIKVYRPRRFVF